jgi:phosphohistidine phosphatase
MTIYFVRHASAGQRKPNPKKDEKRPLDSDGILQCTQMGRTLATLDTSVDAVVSSPLKRATQTAALIANEIGYEGKVNIENALRPEAKYEAFRDMLRKHAKAESLLLVGHNPNLSEFLGNLIAENGARAFVDLKKGAVSKVESEQKKFVLQWLLTPRLANASSQAGAAENSGIGAASRNGSGQSAMEAESSNGKTADKKRPQAALTTKSRPKMSRK